MTTRTNRSAINLMREQRSIGAQCLGLGPRRIVLTDDGHAMPAPYSVVDNGDSFLDATDLVFVDAISTGYKDVTAFTTNAANRSEAAAGSR